MIFCLQVTGEILHNYVTIGKPNDLDDMYGEFTMDEFTFYNIALNDSSVLEMYQPYHKFTYFTLNVSY